MRTNIIEISGYPIPEPVHVPVYGDGPWLLTFKWAMELIREWADAPAEPDVIREFDYNGKGGFATALFMEGEIILDFWNPREDGLFSTETMPFDFEIDPV